MTDYFNSFDSEKNTFLKMKMMEVIVILALLMVGNFIFGLVGYAIAALFMNNREIYFYTMPLFWSFPFLFSFILFYAIFMKKKGEKYNHKFMPNYFLDIFIYLIIFSGLFLVNEFLTSLIPTDLPALKELYKMVSDVFMELKEYPITMVFMIAILAPIFEEIFFRGIILKGLLNNGMKPTKAIIIQALLFGLVHMNPWQFIGASLLGAFFGWVYYRTQSLFHTIFLHFINNALGCYFILEYNEIDYSAISEYTTESLLGIGLGVSIIFSIVYHYYTKNRTWKLS